MPDDKGPELCHKLGLIRKPGGKKRDPKEEVIGENGTIVKSCRLLFGVLRESAYIGRLF